MRQYYNKISISIFVTFLLSGIIDVMGEENVTISMGYSSKLFVDVSQDDAHAVTKMLVKLMIEKKNINADHNAFIYDKTENIINALRNKIVDVVAMPVLEYFKVNTATVIDPVAVAEINGQVYERYCLLVHKNSPFEKISDLKGTRATIGSTYMGGLPLLWLDVLLLKQNLGTSQEFFKSLNNVSKASQIVLPVFVRQADMCLVTEKSFKILAELNPQLGQDLRIIEMSPFFCNGIICFRQGLGESKYRTLVQNTLYELQDDPVGDQLLNIFKLDNIIPFKEEYFQSVEDLLSEYENMTTPKTAGL